MQIRIRLAPTFPKTIFSIKKEKGKFIFFSQRMRHRFKDETYIYRNIEISTTYGDYSNFLFFLSPLVVSMSRFSPAGRSKRGEARLTFRGREGMKKDRRVQPR